MSLLCPGCLREIPQDWPFPRCDKCDQVWWDAQRGLDADPVTDRDPGDEDDE